MASRLDFHKVLVTALGSNNVYFQPPETIKMSYPCIVYDLDNKVYTYADGLKYNRKDLYSVMIITQSYSDSVSISDKLLNELEYSSFDRNYTSDNLYHVVLSIYF
jgi:hypothetical protein